jgi:hypothetical protein
MTYMKEVTNWRPFTEGSGIRVERDMSTDSWCFALPGETVKMDAFVMTTSQRPMEAVMDFLYERINRNPHVRRWQDQQAIEIHPVNLISKVGEIPIL